MSTSLDAVPSANPSSMADTARFPAPDPPTADSPEAITEAPPASAPSANNISANNASANITTPKPRKRTKILTSPKVKPPAATLSSEDVVAQQAQEWRKYYEQLQVFYQEHGHFNIPVTPEYAPLRDWIAWQQRDLAALSPARKLLLLHLGLVDFDTTATTTTTNPKNNGELLSFQPSSNIDYSSDDDRRIGGLHISTPAGVGADVYEQNWLARFQELKRFVKHHGHFRIPKEDDSRYKSLAYWVTRQRRRKAGKPNCGRPLTSHQISLLDQLNFPWVVPSGRQQEVITTTATRPRRSYYSDNDNDDDSLSELDNDNSDDDEDNKTNNSSSSADMDDPYERKWLESYQQLKSYVQRHGTFSFPEKDPHWKPLAYWVTRQRRLKLGKLNGQVLPKHRELLLNKIDFPWTPGRFRQTIATHVQDQLNRHDNMELEDDDVDDISSSEGEHDQDDDDSGDRGRFEKLWMERYRELKLFHDKFGNFSVPKHDPEYKSLAYWIVSQRRRRAGKRNCGKPLPRHQVQLLDKIGFPWDGHEARRQMLNDDDADDDSRSFDDEQLEEEDEEDVESEAEPETYNVHPHASEARTRLENSYEKRWMEKYHHLKQFYKNYGHFCVEKSGKQYKSLAYWVIRQRELRNGKRKNESLLPHREELLEAIGFPWDGRKARMDKDDDGSEDEYPRQVYQYKSENEDEEEEGDLSSDSEVSTSFDPSNAYEKRWMSQYSMLKQFYRDHGHFCIEKSGPQYKSLAYWVHRQRELRNGKRPGETFPKHREELLDKIGFQWNGRLARREKERLESRGGRVRNAQEQEDSDVEEDEDEDEEEEEEEEEARWMERYQELKAYVKRHGNFSVSTTDRKQKELVQWIKRQRQLRFSKKHDGLAQHRISLLDGIDFPWRAVRVSRDRSNSNSAYRNGSESESDEVLAEDRQVDTEAAGDLAEAIGGNTGFHDQQWFTKFVELKRFYQTYGHFWCTRWSGEEHRPLSYWVEKQRQFYLSDEIPPYRKKLLDNIGFPWNWREAKKQYLDLEDVSDDSDDASSGDEEVVETSKKRKRNDTTAKRPKVSAGKSALKSESDADLMAEVQGNPYGEVWLKQYDSLKRFYEEHGHFIIPHTPDKFRSFYKWVWFQRKRLTQKDPKKMVVAAKIELLNRINFDWEGA